ncbi:MAG TPA: hypothetical protein VL727_15380 [Puia sp.]|jgi:hypothetical protein|nr:hypothetical protein [Puia sp.]
MKKFFVFFLIVASVSAIVSCNKNSSGPNAGHGPNALFPLTAGDTWYYADSTFNDTMLTGFKPDTMTINSQRLTDNAGNVYTGITDPQGWFEGSYILVDPGNTAVYEVDSPAYSPYVFFQTVGQDGPVGTGADYSNPGCPIHSIQYGYANPVTIAGYSCLKNAEVVTDCNNIIREEVVSYVSPGVGVVRIEDYVADSTKGNNLYEDYSQTLTNKVLH